MKDPYSKTLINLRENAWFGDNPIELSFPSGWIVKVINNQPLKPLTKNEMQSALRNPITSLPLAGLAKGKKSAVIIIDDLKRPTPAENILELIIEEILAAGIRLNNIKIVVACGVHEKLSRNELVKKVGENICSKVSIACHDCHVDCQKVGYTRRGIPIFINKTVLAAELKIGVGGIYPHPVASFSGGAKILAPGVAGFKTIRQLHNIRVQQGHQTDVLDNQFRQEIEEMADLVGLDFVVNVILNQERNITALFAGNRKNAFLHGVEHYKKNYSIAEISSADIIISDQYPFDIDFLSGFERSFWPFETSPHRTSKVLLASCPLGFGKHELFVDTKSPLKWLVKKLAAKKIRDLLALNFYFLKLKKMIMRRQQKIYIVSGRVDKCNIAKIIPKGEVLSSWNDMLDLLIKKHGKNKTVTIILYRCAPYIILV